MEFKTTFTDAIGAHDRSSVRGFALTEVMVSSAVASILFVFLVAFSIYGGRIFQSMGNFVQVEGSSRRALDVVSQQLRQCKGVTTFATNSVTVVDSDAAALQFTYDPDQQTLSRVKGGISRVLLSGCTQLQFTMLQRTLTNGSFDASPATSVDTCKALQISWVCGRTRANGVTNSDTVQSARVVIRKKSI